jgi:CheY-like chemotaxis protein
LQWGGDGPPFQAAGALEPLSSSIGMAGPPTWEFPVTIGKEITLAPPPSSPNNERNSLLHIRFTARQTMKILVAEDSSLPRLALQELLTECGHEVAVARNGEEAWAILNQSEPPALAVIDWMMPGIDGVELCRQVRDNPATAGVYLILLSARSRPEDIVAGLESGAHQYLVKPLDPDELRARLRAAARLVEERQQLVARIRELEACQRQ